MVRRQNYLFVALCYILLVNPVLAQQGGGTAIAKSITCPANGGAASIQVLPANGSRLSFTILNDGVGSPSIRFGFLNSGTANLDDTNSTILVAGASYAGNQPGLYYGRIVCESTTNAAVVIHITEVSFP